MAVKFTGRFTVRKNKDWSGLLDEHTTPSGKPYADILCSSSTKKKDGKYETDFWGKLRFWGDSVARLKEYGLQEKDVIEVKEGTHTNFYDKDKKMTFQNYAVWEFDVVNKEKKAPTNPELIDDGTPFDPLSDTALPF